MVSLSTNTAALKLVGVLASNAADDDDAPLDEDFVSLVRIIAVTVGAPPLVAASDEL